MASTVNFLNYVLDLLKDETDITFKKMMGEFLLYRNGVLFGGVYDDRFLVKKTRSVSSFGLPEEIPYPGAKPMLSVETEDRTKIKELIDTITEDLK